MKKSYSLLTVFASVGLFNAQIVISQIYCGGGSSTATYKNDFIELFNKSNSNVTLEGAYIHYAVGNLPFAANNSQALPNLTIPAGGYYLIKQGGGTTGGTTELPTPDYVPGALINFGTLNGKVAITTSSTAPTSSDDASVIDFIGYGTATNMSEGNANGPAANNIQALIRKNFGCTDTNNNAADFELATPSPRNSAIAVSVCATLGVNDMKNNRELIKNSIVFSDLYFNISARVSIYNLSGQMIKTTEVTTGEKLNLSSLTQGTYVVEAQLNGQSFSQKFIKK